MKVEINAVQVSLLQCNNNGFSGKTSKWGGGMNTSRSACKTVEHGVTKSCGALFPIQPEVTEGGVVLYQNNTYPIMAGGCHIVMTAACSFNTHTAPKKIKNMYAHWYYRTNNLHQSSG